MIRAIAMINRTKAKLIQMGDRTHHHDHAIYPVSFRPMKSTVKRPTNPMPPDDVVVLLLILLFYSSV